MEDNNRRKFLKDSVTTLTLLGINNVLANSIVQALGESAFAQATTGVEAEKKYIYFSLDGAPPRWFFDLPLTPNGTSDAYPTSNIIGTYITKDGNNAVLSNSTWKDPSSGLHLPPVWGSNPASSSGSFEHITNNAFFFRGVDMEIDNHEVTRLRNQAPTIGGISIAGVFAGKSGAPIPGVVSGSIGNSFKSNSLITPVTVAHTSVTNTNNSIISAMKYVSGDKPITDSMMKQQLREFESYAKDNGLMDYGLKSTKEKADKMIVDGVAKFTDQWASVYAKYNVLVAEAITNSTNSDKFILKQSIANPFLKNPADNRMAFLRSGAVPISASIETIQGLLTDKSTVPQLAAIFAATEILVKNNITSICTFSLPGTVMNTVSVTDKPTTNITTDQHDIGTLLSTYVTTHFYRALLSCLNSLAKSLKDSNMWQNTMIQFGSEFGRYPRADLSGSDHQVLAGSALLLSGSFSKTRVLGNITNANAAAYKGFTGVGTGITALSGERLRVNDVVKTVCAYLNVSDVTANGVSFLTRDQKDLEKKNVA